ncbi:hypothetical protein [Streptomyces griseoluteus]|uniref:hypothetical protein n=1 Tax=Streptomyces griseoluteus TaxID=29306 RepID=UPI00343CBDCD
MTFTPRTGIGDRHVAVIGALGRRFAPMFAGGGGTVGVQENDHVAATSRLITGRTLGAPEVVHRHLDRS